MQPAQTAQEKSQSSAADKQTVKEENAGIGVEAPKPERARHDASRRAVVSRCGARAVYSLGHLFSQRDEYFLAHDTGPPTRNEKVSDEERARIIRESDYNLDGKPPQITPNQYWSMASFFNPKWYNPDHWLKAAKAAGFTYVVLTTRHHEGFALWPSAYGNFNTKLFMGGRDLLKDYVAACRRNGLKVGFYYSPPDWFFDRDYMNFLYSGAARMNPEFPKFGPSEATDF